MGVMNLYRIFRETRNANRRRATLAVTGDSERAAAVASILGTQRGTRGAEIMLDVPERGDVSLSGKAVEEADEIPLPSTSESDVLGRLARRLVVALDDDYLAPLGRGYPVLRRAVCEEIIQKNARQNAVIGALPIPGADMPVMTANQGRMVLNLAAAYGEELSRERARELLGVLAAGFGMRALGRQAVKVVPVGGWAASSVIGYAGTLAMGQAAMLYFERGKQALDSEEMAGIRQRAQREAREYLSNWRREGIGARALERGERLRDDLRNRLRGGR